jgi:Reverse transcriptase (RNA-dependent DNA polymerase)
MILSAAHGWKSRQVDFTNAFCQAPQKDLIIVELPQYYKPKGLKHEDVVLKLNKSLYGQVTSPKLFWEHLQKGMLQLGFEQSWSDPCLFIHKQHKLMVALELL